MPLPTSAVDTPIRGPYTRPSLRLQPSGGTLRRLCNRAVARIEYLAKNEWDATRQRHHLIAIAEVVLVRFLAACARP